MKKETVNLLKFKKLQAMAGLSLWEATGVLQALWMFAARETPQGDIGRFSNEDIAYGIEFPLERIDRVVEVLVATRWLDASEAHRLVVHDWPDHCEDAVKMRLVRAGLPFADGTPAKASRMAQAERARHEHGEATPTEQRAHPVRTACARDVDSGGGVCTTSTYTSTYTSTDTLTEPLPFPSGGGVQAQREVIDAWNAAVANRPGWCRCTGIPKGEVGRMLAARCRDPDWMRDYPAALERMVQLAWMKRAKLQTFVRPDTVRKILDEEWKNDESRDLFEHHHPSAGALR